MLWQTPLGTNDVFTLAASFIVTCPSDNPPIPARANQPLVISNQSNLAPGQNATLQFTPPAEVTTLYVAIMYGLNVVSTKLVENTFLMPSTVIGTSYVKVTTDPNGVDDNQTVAGPAQISLPFDSNENPTHLSF